MGEWGEAPPTFDRSGDVWGGSEGAFADGDEFARRLARMCAAAAADMQAEFARQWLQPALQRADDAGGDAGRMPVHAHHGAEGLEPERMRQATQEFVTGPYRFEIATGVGHCSNEEAPALVNRLLLAHLASAA